MGHRTIKRVLMDFNWPLGDPWEGYMNPYYRRCPSCKGRGEVPGVYPVTCVTCSLCDGEGIDPTVKKDYDSWEPHDPPAGAGWQLWETTSEGSPISPVFATPEELAEWCETNATVFAGIKATKAEWLSMFADLDSASIAVMSEGTPMTVMGLIPNGIKEAGQ